MKEELSLGKRLFILLGVLILVVLNEKIGYSDLGIILVLIEVFIVVFLVFIKQFTLAFIMHMLFVLTALEWPADLLLRPNIFTYRTVHVSGISISTLVLAFLFVMSHVFFDLRFQVKRIAFWGMLIIAIGLFTGILGMTLGDYKTHFFIGDFAYWVAVVLSVSLFTKILSARPDSMKLLEWVFIAVLISRSIVKFLGIFLGLQKGMYGGVAIFSFDAIDILILMLIFALQEQEHWIMKVLIIISWILGSLAVVIAESSGKGILLSFAVLYILVWKLFKLRKYMFIRMYLGLFIIIGLFVILPRYLSYLIENNILFASKFNQAMSLLSFSCMKDPYVLPPSPQTRILELYNIAAYYLENPVFFLTGRGFGGYFEDKAFYNYNASNLGAYSTEEVISRKFVYPHESFNVLLLKFGLVGILYYLYLLYKVLKLRRFQTISISPFLKLCSFVLVLFFFGYSLKLVFLLGFSISLIFQGGDEN